jgi:hypothetical protein
MKKALPVILTVIVLLGAGAAYFIYSSSAYTGYSEAFNKTSKITSTEYDTAVKATVDGQATTATGNMKIRDITTNVNFINEMDIGGQRVTQFCDGEYIYMDADGQKTKFKIGEKPESNQRERGEFSMDSYIQEFSMLLDASKIKDLKIAEKLSRNIVQKITKESVSAGTEYKVTLAPGLVDDIFQSALDDQLGEASAPQCTLQSFNYTATANQDKYIDSITYYMDMDVVFPAALTGEAADSEKRVELEVTLEYVNPGQPADFTLPGADGY